MGRQIASNYKLLSLLVVEFVYCTTCIRIYGIRSCYIYITNNILDNDPGRHNANDRLLDFLLLLDYGI